MSKISVVILLVALVSTSLAAPQFGNFGNLFNQGGFRPGGNAAGVGQASGNLFANAQGFGSTIPIGPFGSVSLAESTGIGVGK